MSRRKRVSFLSDEWWNTPITKYNKDGTVYRKQSEPGRFYTWLALEPMSDTANMITIGILIVVVITTAVFGIGF